MEKQIENKVQVKSTQKKTLTWAEDLKPLFKGKKLTDEQIKQSIGEALLAKQKRINGYYSK